ncbi:hypothetical protein SUGI_0182010 [Cryptomeria japonica]|nr:hypothetical protein SUGI_0182010 [Cryptomeria japonica]
MNHHSSGTQMQMQMQMQMQIHGARPPFTPSQWQELEHQALIFKYMVAGIPVPPDLLVPIRKSLEAISAGLFHPHHHPPDMPWSSTFQLGYGKNCDPEPGRCRRTDGKKWRCSKDAFPDSKYCERHMHRGRNRSRKPVETPHASSHSSSLTLSTTARPTNNNSSSISSNTNNSHTFSSPGPYSSSSRLGGAGIVVQPNTNVNHFNLDSPSFARDYRYMKGDMDEHIFFSSEVSGTASRGLGIDSQSLLSSTSSVDAGWRSMQPQPSPKVNALFNSFPKQQHQHSFLNSSFGGTVKMEAQDHDEDNAQEQDHEHEQPLRHFFDDWPARSRDSSSGLSWCDLEERCNTSSTHANRASATSSSTTQLSISIPINSSDFSASKSK